MAFGTPVVGTTAYSASAGTSVAPAYPTGVLATDKLVLFVGQKPSTANGGTVTTPTGWTLRDSLTAAGGYGTTLGADTGNTNLFAYTKDTVTGGETGTLSVTLGTNGVSWAFIVRIPTGGGVVSFGSADGQRTTTPTSPMSIALTNGASPTAFQTGDLALWAMCIPTDVTTPSQFSAESITATGATFNTAVELNEPDSTTGNDIGGYSAWATVASGTSSTAPTVTATLAGTLTNVRGPVVLLRLREAQAISFTADSGSYTYTGQDTTLLQTRSFNAESGNFAYTGQDADLSKASAARILDAGAGSFTYSGQAATLTTAESLVASSGTFGLVGQDAKLAQTYVFNAQSGAFTVAGAAATLATAELLIAEAGAFTVAGQAATLAWWDIHGLDAQPASYTITGQPATLTETKVLNATPGVFSLSGKDAAMFVVNGGFTADAGSFALSGAATTLLRRRVFNAETGAFGEAPSQLYVDLGYVNTGYVTGTEATLLVGRVIQPSAGSFTITGAATTMAIGMLYPLPSDVRSGVVYGPGGIYTGTLSTSKALYLFDD